MAGAAKRRANNEREEHVRQFGNGSSSGETSSSGKATRSAHSGAGSRVSQSGSQRGGFDGNRDPTSPRLGSPTSPPGSGAPRSGGTSTSPPRTSPSVERDPTKSRPQVDAKNLDLGSGARSIMTGQELANLQPRPPLSTLGTACRVALNTFQVMKIPNDKAIYQYEVLIGNGAEKRGVIRKVWESKAIQSAIGKQVLFDGNRLAWSLRPIDRELRILVDLDQQQGRTPRPGKEDKHHVKIRQTNRVRFDVLDEYLRGQCSFNNSVLEAVTFLDHLLREFPAQKYTQIKRSFFARGQSRNTLGSGVEHMGGAYQSLRIVHGGAKAQLSINVDVANGTFWTESMLHNSAMQLLGCRDVNDLVERIRKTGGDKGRAALELRKFRKLHVIAKHRGGQTDEYVIDRFIYTSAKDHKFEKDGKQVSIYDYFAKTFNIRLSHPDLPLVKMTRGKNTVLPMEVLRITENQRYVYKLDERQTSSMIKFCATPPQQRWAAIDHALKMLSWGQDPALKAFGMQVNPAKTTVDGRLLTAPKVVFGQGDAKPGTSGRWDLKNKKFLAPNLAPLKSWAWCIVPGGRGGKPDKSTVENFIKQFVNVYKSHGGRVENTNPPMTLASGDDVGAHVTAAWNAAGNAANMRPQILVFVLPDKNANTYGRIKRSAECRYGVVSQCMQYAHIQKCQPQYISNVCMKFNAKLGGSTSRAVGTTTTGPGGAFKVPTLVIGADVSHAAPGSQAASMAALTVSMDKVGIRYAAACETNGFRVEMIQTDTINSVLKPLIGNWVNNVGNGQLPKCVIYFRDGVSEGQYAHVLQQEVHDMKALLKTANPGVDIPFVVVVGSKRHHVRFFPEKGDRNGNALPGTLVETGVTHPFENDFYLCAHAAIKGTARPMNYTVLLNEAGMSNADLQTLIYEQSYQYIRATTPISQHPAIYYAHQASNRAIPHDPKWSGSSDTTPSAVGGKGSHGDGSSSDIPEFEKLMPMPNQSGIQTSMWFV